MVEWVPGFDVKVWIAPGAVRSDASVAWPWVDITSDVRAVAGTSAEVGRADERSTVGPGQCSLTLDNRTGKYCRLNPLGTYYGSLSRNTPLRVRVTPTADEVTDSFTRSVTDGWGAATSGQPWYAYWSAGTVADFDVTGSAGTHAVQTNVSHRTSYLPTVRLEDADIKATVTVAVPTGAAHEPLNLLLRGQDTEDTLTYYMCRLQVAPTTNAVTAKIIAIVDGVETELGSAATGVTHAAATPLHARAEAVGDVIRMRTWQGGVEPGTWAVSVIDTRIPLPGWVGIRSGVASGNTNAKPLVFSYDDVTVSGPHDLFVGEVPEWPVRWDKSGVDSTAPITAAGVFRRLGQGASPLRSPAYRALTSPSDDPYRIAYWPLEEESGATTVSSPYGSPQPLITGDVDFGGYTGFAASPRALQFGTGSVQFPVPAYSSLQHKVIALWHIPNTLAADTALMRLWLVGGSLAFLEMSISSGGAITIVAYTTAFVLTDTYGPIAFDVNDGVDRSISVELTQDGADIDVRVFVQRADDGTGTLSDDTFAGETIGRIAYVQLARSDSSDAAVAHLAVGNDTSDAFGNWLVPSGDTPAGVTGYAGETAKQRLLRIGTEEGLPVSVLPGDTVEMGPQPVGTLLDIMRECETADHGVLFESGTGLAYQPRTARYVSVDGGVGSVPALELDVDNRELGEAPEPVDDDQALANDVTVKRSGGGEERYEATGAYSPTGPVGRYEGSAEVNIRRDADLIYHAQWLVALGTFDDLRWPLIHLQLSTDAALALRWLGTGVGFRITVANPPDGVGPDALDLFVEGWSVQLREAWWTVALNCSPARPYEVFTLEGSGNTSRLDTAGSELAYPVTDVATSLPVATSSGPPWTTTATRPGDFPFDIGVSGERLTVTAATTATPAFGAAGTVAHADNASVVPGLPAGVAVGRLMLLIAVIRNSGVGEPDDETLAEAGWLHLAGEANLQVFYRYFQSGDAAPTVPFHLGVAGATCSARIVDFSGLSHILAGGDVAEQLNSSSDSIAYAGYVPEHAGGVEIIVGWKQNDHTGVTAVAGFTESFDSFTTTGDDQSLFMQHRIYTTPADRPSGSVTAGGGISAVNRSLVFALRPLQTFTATRSVNGVVKAQAAAAAVGLWRPYVAGL